MNFCRKFHFIIKIRCIPTFCADDGFLRISNTVLPFCLTNLKFPSSTLPQQHQMFVRKHGNIRTNSNVAHIQNDNHYNGSWNVVIDGMLFAIEKQTHTPNFCYYFSKLFDGNVFVLSFILWSNLALNEHRLRIQTHWNDVIIYRKSTTFSNFKSVCNVMFSQKLYFNAISFSSHRRRKIFVHIYCMASNDFFFVCVS